METDESCDTDSGTEFVGKDSDSNEDMNSCSNHVAANNISADNESSSNKDIYEMVTSDFCMLFLVTRFWNRQYIFL